jgi:ubiquinone/menaquinone biosynthesis C-methylase UbiE
VPIHESAARGFAASADAYERGRPAYSSQAIERLVSELGIEPGSRLLDLAAGTGKLTRQLLPTGADVVGVEPVAAMRAKLAALTPNVEALDGTAEQIPLPDGSVDAVVVGQAFHWFDGERALPEIHRVLRPKGALGLIWQARNPSKRWVARLDEIIDRAARKEPRFKTGEWRTAFDSSSLFEILEHAEYEYVQRADVDAVVDRVGSISYVAAMADARRAAILQAVRELLASDPATANRDVIDMPYLAHVYWTRRRDA